MIPENTLTGFQILDIIDRDGNMIEMINEQVKFNKEVFPSVLYH
jgi:hypothetical protein